MEFYPKLRSFIFILIFSIVIFVPSTLIAQKDLGVPVREPIIWGAYAGPGKTGVLDTIYLSFSQYNAPLLRFDPRTEEWEDLGRPAGGKESFICAVTTAPDGKIWGGTFPSAKLFSYDPKTGRSEDYGRMDPDQFYCYPTAGNDGLIYCAIQFQKIDVVVFDPERKTRTSLLPVEARKPGRI